MTNVHFFTVRCVISIVNSSEYRMEQYTDGGHRKDAPHFTFFNLSRYPSKKSYK